MGDGYILINVVTNVNDEDEYIHQVVDAVDAVNSEWCASRPYHVIRV